MNDNQLLAALEVENRLNAQLEGQDATIGLRDDSMAEPVSPYAPFYNMTPAEIQAKVEADMRADLDDHDTGKNFTSMTIAEMIDIVEAVLAEMEAKINLIEEDGLTMQEAQNYLLSNTMFEYFEKNNITNERVQGFLGGMLKRNFDALMHINRES